MTKTRKNKKTKVYTQKNFNSGDGMLTSVWGPSLWHTLHCISFNYPTNPTRQQKKQYRNFVLNLEYVLPCGYCRKNFPNNLKAVPLNKEALKNRNNFSRWMFNLHEQINKMLGKKSGLTYCEVRERYEHFRSRCTIDLPLNKEIKKIIKKTRRVRKSSKGHKSRKNRKTSKENGCVEPLYGKKSQCVIKIVPKDNRINSFQMDKKCVKKR